ncbi:MAG: hypothetical protein FWD01_03815, partial [Defluviitaleaceae bacterium]|nr:hypothetical protein [Defluviitaleaceae bacterium]
KFNDSEIELEAILPDGWMRTDEGQEWYTYHRSNFYENPNPAMFLTGMPLTRVFRPMDLLEYLD